MTNLRNASLKTMLGSITLVAEDDSITGLYFPEHAHKPDAEAFGTTVQLPDDALLTQAAAELQEYLSGTRTLFDVPLFAHGNEFSIRVWDILRDIPYGETTSYGEIATQLGNRRLAQRVGQVVGRNPISIFIPCHRVLGADGSLTGYAGGLERKRFLLELEEPAETTAGRLF